MDQAVKEITPQEVEEKITKGENVQIIDVREPHEWEQGHIAEAELIPLGTVPENLDKFDTSKEIIMVCRSGMRSHNAAEFLAHHGIKAANMVGGMLAWTGNVAR
ncbi:rhodanese-like domain-containing protein [Brevibacillus dissolubilis]|uniref:rhodanese-like domain-containing protein n=1 Tax=Brevibacillus dissolubilis TaxID=1844116 RepID=UPI0011165670|nr:rhodanese-like domain-containing protein [Brevibacillus dissolubilis]